MKRIALLVLIGMISLAGSALAQEAPDDEDSPLSAIGSMSSRSGYWNLGIGVGVMLDPDVFALQAGVDYFITDELAVGPLVQYGGMGKDDSIFGVSGQVKYSAALLSNERVRPYGHVGVGFAQLYEDGRSTTTYLFPIGGGFEFEIRDRLSMDVGGTFNVSDNIYMGLFAGVRYLF